MAAARGTKTTSVFSDLARRLVPFGIATTKMHSDSFCPGPSARVALVVLMLVVLAAASNSAFAASHYVRAGATGTGDGSDWHNAFSALPDQLVRGDIYYVADGTYPSHTFDDPVSGASPVEVRKATAADHGAASGWDSSYGDGAAYWGGLYFSSSYYIFDGVRGYGRDVQEYGFQQDFRGASAKTDAVRFNADFITVSHLKSEWADRGAESLVATRWMEATSGSPNNISVSFCYSKELPGLPFYWIGAHHILIEYVIVEGMRSTPEFHAEIASNRGVTDLTVRYSWFMDAEGTGGWMSMVGQNTDWEIYGNVFEQTGQGGGMGHGIFADNMNDGSSTTGVFHNNTIANHTSGLRSGLAFFTTADISYSNNISRNNHGFTNVGSVVGSHNYRSADETTREFNRDKETSLQEDSNDPFVDSARDANMDVSDWALSGDNLPDSGLSLAAPYNQSCINRLWQGPLASCVARGADGHFDRGAIEFVMTAEPGTQPNAPSNLEVH